MPNPDEPNEEALRRLGRKLDALEVERQRPAAPGGEQATGAGYRFLGEVVGGMLGGLGLGWLFDRLVHTMPWGMIAGLLIGIGVSLYVAVRGASRMADQASKAAGPVRSVPDDDEDD
jgi:ATP synthase protein I